MEMENRSIGGLNIIPLPAFEDNYVWLLQNGNQVIAVDPGDAAPVQRWLVSNKAQLVAILLTHVHADHIGGVPELQAQMPCPVYGAPPIPGITQPVGEGATLSFEGWPARISVLPLPGHTLEHLGYLVQTNPALLFCGDTLFSAGCGRLLGGSAEALEHSLTRLAQLPDDTRVFPGHEYTLSNLAFAAAVEPDNPERDQYAARCRAARAQNHPTLPTTIAIERAVNPFLRVTAPGIQTSLKKHRQNAISSDQTDFAQLRQWKDHFRA